MARSQSTEEFKDECNAAIAESVSNNMYIDECHEAVKSLVAPVTEASKMGPGKTGSLVVKGTKHELEKKKNTQRGINRPSLSLFG